MVKKEKVKKQHLLTKNNNYITENIKPAIKAYIAHRVLFEK